MATDSGSLLGMGAQPDQFGLQPLTARSLVLSALLGTHPPRLPVRALVALGELFGFAEGTVRTALSRMAAGGEVEASDGVYSLGERMRRRQAIQDAGRLTPVEPWDGTWWVGIVDGNARTTSQRRAFRARMRDHRMGELRPDLWLRPANLAGPEPGTDLIVTRGPLLERDPAAVADRLWDRRALSDTARSLAALAQWALTGLATGDPAVLPETFMASVAIVRFLLIEPQLPPALTGPEWPAEGLRRAYNELEGAHGEMMKRFLSSASYYNT